MKVPDDVMAAIETIQQYLLLHEIDDCRIEITAKGCYAQTRDSVRCGRFERPHRHANGGEGDGRQ